MLKIAIFILSIIYAYVCCVAVYSVVLLNLRISKNYYNKGYDATVMTLRKLKDDLK